MEFLALDAIDPSRVFVQVGINQTTKLMSPRGLPLHDMEPVCLISSWLTSKHGIMQDSLCMAMYSTSCKPFTCWFLLTKQEIMLVFSVINLHWKGTGIPVSFSWNTRNRLSYMVKIMAADDLRTPGARVSAAVDLILLKHDDVSIRTIIYANDFGLFFLGLVLLVVNGSW